MVHDIGIAAAPTFVEYVNNRSFAPAKESPGAGRGAYLRLGLNSPHQPCRLTEGCFQRWFSLGLPLLAYWGGNR